MIEWDGLFEDIIIIQMMRFMVNKYDDIFGEYCMMRFMNDRMGLLYSFRTHQC